MKERREGWYCYERESVFGLARSTFVALCVCEVRGWTRGEKIGAVESVCVRLDCRS